MVQMAPNKSIISATVVDLENYAAQPDFYLLQLQVTSSKKSTDQIQMPGTEKGARIKAIVAKTTVDDLKLVKGTKVECELKKVSLDLWRVQSISLKATASKQKKK